MDFSIPHPQASFSHSCMCFYAGIAADNKGGERDRSRQGEEEKMCVCVCMRARGLFFKLSSFFLFAPVCAPDR